MGCCTFTSNFAAQAVSRNVRLSKHAKKQFGILFWLPIKRHRYVGIPTASKKSDGVLIRVEKHSAHLCNMVRYPGTKGYMSVRCKISRTRRHAVAVHWIGDMPAAVMKCMSHDLVCCNCISCRTQRGRSSQKTSQRQRKRLYTQKTKNKPSCCPAAAAKSFKQ